MKKNMKLLIGILLIGLILIPQFKSFSQEDNISTQSSITDESSTQDNIKKEKKGQADGFFFC